MYLKSSVFGITTTRTLTDGIGRIDEYLDLVAAMGVPLEALTLIDEERKMLVDEVERRASLYGGFDVGQATKKAFGNG